MELIEKILVHYFRESFKAAGLNFNNENTAEILTAMRDFKRRLKKELDAPEPVKKAVEDPANDSPEDLALES